MSTSNSCRGVVSLLIYREIVSVSILIGVILVVSTLIGVALTSFSKKRKEKMKINKLEPDLRPFLDAIIISLEKGEKIDRATIKKLSSAINSEAYFEYFNDYISSVYDKVENKIELARFIREMPGLIPRVTANLKSHRLDRRFISMYLTGLYRYDNELTTNIIMSNLEHKSSYIKTNALSSLGLMGNSSSTVNALLLINQSEEIEFTIKCITGVLDNFKGNFVELDDELISVLGRLSEKLRVAVINHFTNVGYIPAAELLYTRVKDIKGVQIDTSKEAEIATIKYLSSVKYHPAYEYLVNNLTREDWVIVAMSLKAISNYMEFVTNELRDTTSKLIVHKNGYVRQYAAKLFVEVSKDTALVKDFISSNSKNKSVKVCLCNALFEHGDIGYDEYAEMMARN